MNEPFLQLEQFFKQHFEAENLQFFVCRSDSREQVYFRISNNLSSSQLNYLPSFHIIGICLTPTSYSLKLVSHHSKVLEEYHLDISDSAISVPLKLKNFCKNSLSLCPGIDRGKLSGKETFLIETLNEEIVYRSRKCLFATNSSNSPCHECLKLKLLSDLNHDSDSSKLPSLEVDVCDMVDSGETIVTEIVLFQPGLDNFSQESIIVSADNNLNLGEEKKDKPFPESFSQPSASTSKRRKSRRVRKPEEEKVISGQTNFPETEVENLISGSNLAKTTRSKECSGCGKTFKMFSALKRHLVQSADCSSKVRKRKTKRKSIKKCSTVDSDVSNRIVFSQQCPICLHTYNQKIQFDLDQKNHNENLPELDSPVSCPVCNVVVFQRRFLNDHFHNVHDNSNDDGDVSICCVCFAQMPQKRLKYHFRERHKPKENGLLCPVCGKTIKWTQNDLKIHLACAHGVDEDCSTPTSQHVCPDCGKSYGHADRLKQHVFRAHSRAASFPCDECDKVFCALSKIIEHKVCKHLKIRPFKCRLCDYEASQMNNVYKHCQHKHGFRGKRGDVQVDQELMVKIRKDLNYDYCGLSVQKVYSK